jgi:hypothetical protein
MVIMARFEIELLSMTSMKQSPNITLCHECCFCAFAGQLYVTLGEKLSQKPLEPAQRTEYNAVSQSNVPKTHHIAFQTIRHWHSLHEAIISWSSAKEMFWVSSNRKPEPGSRPLHSFVRSKSQFAAKAPVPKMFNVQ